MRPLALILPAYLLPLLISVLPAFLASLRGSRLPLKALGFLIVPLLSWYIAQLFVTRYATLANAAIEPALVGFVTGLVHSPVIAIPGQNRREAIARFIVALGLSLCFGLLVA